MQKLPRFVFMSVGLSLLLAIAAAAQTTAPETSPSSQPQTTSPAQSPPSAQPQAPPSGPQSSGSSSARPSTPQGGNGQSIDQELQLTEDQKQKIAAVVGEENKQIESVRNDNSLSPEQKQQKVLAIRQAGSPKIKAILTPEQLQKLAAIQQRVRQQPSGSDTPSQAPPQR